MSTQVNRLWLASLISKWHAWHQIDGRFQRSALIPVVKPRLLHPLTRHHQSGPCRQILDIGDGTPVLLTLDI